MSVGGTMKEIDATEDSLRASYEGFAQHMPLEYLVRRLASLPPEQRLEALTPEHRLEGLTPDQILNALPSETREELARKLRSLLPRPTRVVRDLELAEKCFRQVFEYAAEQMPIEILLRRMATLPPEQRFVGITAEQRLAGLTPAQLLLALPLDTCEELAEKLHH
jgi:hypothetical protein